MEGGGVQPDKVRGFLWAGSEGHKVTESQSYKVTELQSWRLLKNIGIFYITFFKNSD
jgi:hypothetical protein